MTFRVENHGVVKGVDPYHDLHGTESGATCGELAGTPIPISTGLAMDRVSHGCIIAWLFGNLTGDVNRYARREHTFYIEVANIDVLVERRNT